MTRVHLNRGVDNCEGTGVSLLRAEYDERAFELRRRRASGRYVPSVLAVSFTMRMHLSQERAEQGRTRLFLPYRPIDNNSNFFIKVPA